MPSLPGVVAVRTHPLSLLCSGCCVLLSFLLLQMSSVILGVLLCFPFSLPKSRKNNMLEGGQSSVLKRNNGLMYF